MTKPGKKRVVPMEVLALGMSRSGTESVKRALEALGYLRTYHGVSDLVTTQDGWIWGELVEKKFGTHPKPITSADFDRILGDCRAISDLPCIAFWPELMDAYPTAKIVLVERDVEAWYISFKKVCIDEVFSWRADLCNVGIRLGLLPQNPNFFIYRLYLEYFHARDKKELAHNARAVYKEHYDAIEARAKAEGRPLLRMRLEDGWAPICEFLGKDKPLGFERGALPRSNDWRTTSQHTRYYQNLALQLMALNTVKLIGRVFVVFAAGASLGYWYRARA